MGRLRKLRCPQFHWLWRLCVPFVGRALAHADRGGCHGQWPSLRVWCNINTLCCSRVLISTKRIVGCATASQIASASAASFYRLCPMMTAPSAMTLTHIKTGRSWESALARARWHPYPARRHPPPACSLSSSNRIRWAVPSRSSYCADRRALQAQDKGDGDQVEDDVHGRRDPAHGQFKRSATLCLENRPWPTQPSCSARSHFTISL